MNRLRLRRHGPKHIQITGVHPLLAACLHELPEILGLRDQPAAARRLSPPPTADEKINADWQSLIAPELRHLFVSAGETVTRDLTGLQPDPDRTGAWQVTFPLEHLNAWMSALNQARLILGELFQITERDMHPAEFDPVDPRHVAMLKIEVLGELLLRFVDMENGQTGAEPDAIAGPIA
jgi:hypothetical protein